MIHYILFDVAPVDPPVLRVFHEIAGREPHPGLRRREHSDHSTPATHLPDRSLNHVGRGDLLVVDLREAVELERVLKPVLKTADRLGESISVFLGQVISRPSSTFSIWLQPDLRRTLAPEK